MTLNLDKSTWKRVAFGDAIESVTDRVDDPSQAGVERYVGLEHLDPGVMTVQRWDTPDKVEAQKLRFRAGDVIFGRRRAYQKKVALADFEGIRSAHALVLRARLGHIHPDFLPVFLSSDYFLDRAIAISVGSLSPTVNWRDLKVQEFDLPPIDEQKRIADLLWAVERHRRTLALVSEANRSATGALISRDFVGDGDSTLSDLVGPDGIRIGPFGAQLHAYDYVDGGEVPVVMPQDMVDGRISQSQIKTITAERASELAVHFLREGDILLPRRGELDRRALVTEAEAGWLCGTGSVRVRLKPDVDSRAVLLSLSSARTVDWLTQHATGTTMPNLNAGIVSRIPIQLPPDEALPDAVGRVRQLDDSQSSRGAEQAALSHLQSALLNEIFGGS